MSKKHKQHGLQRQEVAHCSGDSSAMHNHRVCAPQSSMIITALKIETFTALERMYSTHILLYCKLRHSIDNKQLKGIVSWYKGYSSKLVSHMMQPHPLDWKPAQSFLSMAVCSPFTTWQNAIAKLQICSRRDVHELELKGLQLAEEATWGRSLKQRKHTMVSRTLGISTADTSETQSPTLWSTMHLHTYPPIRALVPDQNDLVIQVPIPSDTQCQNAS